MSSILSTTGNLDSTAILAPLRPPGAIPQSEFNPLTQTLLAPEDALARALAKRRHWDNLAEKAALEPDAFFPEHPFQPIAGEDSAARKVRLSNRVFLRSRLDGGALPSGDMGYEVTRARIATKLFDGRGADDDAAFNAEVKKHAQGSRDRRELAAAVDTAARTAALQGVVNPGAGAAAWKTVREELKAMPGYDPPNEADYAQRFRAMERAQRDAMASYASQLQGVWLLMPEGAGDPVRALPSERGRMSAQDAAYGFYSTMDAPAREGFKDALAAMVRAMPKAGRAAFFGFVAKTVGRDIENLPRDAAVGVSKTVRDGGVVGWQDFFGSNEAVRKRDLEVSASNREFYAKSDFFTDVRDLVENYDPAKAPHDGWMGAVESGIAGAPGAIASTLIGLVPVVGNVAFYGMAKEDVYQSVRRRLNAGGFKGDASAVAEDLSTVGALPYALLDKVGAQAVAARMPWLNKALTAATDKLVTNTLARATMRTVAGGGAETATEMGQDYVAPLVQEMAASAESKIPGVQFRGKGGVFDGFWTQSLQTFVAILPLSMVGGAHGHFADQQLSALQAASDVELKAFGYDDSSISKIRGAAGPGALSLEVAAANETRDPNSETAKAATAEREAELAAQSEATAAAKASGVLPAIVQSRDGYLVLDGETKEEVGSAPDRAGALALASAHSAAMDDLRAHQVVYLATSLEAGEAAMAGDSETKSRTFELGTMMTELRKAAENPAALAGFYEQQQIREKINGGTGVIAKIMLGEHIADFANGVREFTHRLFWGSSVNTVFHETFHSHWRRQLAAGTMTQAEGISFVRAVNSIMEGRRVRGGERDSLEFFQTGLADADITPKMVDEAIAEIAELEILRTRKKGKDAKVLQVGSGIITRNLTALLKLAPGATRKFAAFFDAFRGILGLAATRAVVMRQEIRRGNFDEAAYEAFLNKLTGTTEQAQHDQAAAEVGAEVLADEGWAPSEDNPFSLGRATVTPTADTRQFEGAEGSPSVVGPASFSIGEYRGLHTAPHAEKGSSLDDLSAIYPDDIYSAKAAQYYGHWGDDRDRASIAVIQRMRGKPNEKVAIYRAIPSDLMAGKDRIKELNRLIGYHAQFRFFPMDDSTVAALREKYQDQGTYNEQEQQILADLEQQVAALEAETATPEINPGDWVTIDRAYAKDHGGSALDGNYKILKKTVPAKHLYTNGDSIHEWGYAPEGAGTSFSIGAFHGTPHKVDQFSLDKIGTGEGAQAYGWGLYFADSSSVAASYTQSNADLYGLTVDRDGKKHAAIFSHSSGFLKESYFDNENDSSKWIQEQTGGNLYTVTLKVDDADLLDWDKPLSEQSEKVRAALVPYEFRNHLDGRMIHSELADREEFEDLAPGERYKPISVILSAAGIRGIRYLDGNSRDGGSGSYNYVIFDAADIEITHENGQPVKLEDAGGSYALAPARFIESLQINAAAKIADPKTKTAIFQRMVQKLAELKREFAALTLAFQTAFETEYQKLSQADQRKVTSIRKEAAMREALRRVELEDEAHARHGGILHGDDFSKLWNQPTWEAIALPNDRLHGRIKSFAQWAKSAPDYAGEYDGAGDVSRVAFGGTNSPDQIAQELYDNGVLPAPTPDALWDSLKREQASAGKFREYMKKAAADVAAARLQAKAETKVWEHAAIQKEIDAKKAAKEDFQAWQNIRAAAAASFTPYQRLLRSMVILDAILAVVPADIRGRVGGYTQLAKLTTDEARLKFLAERINRLDAEVEKWLVREYGRMWERLKDREVVKKNVPGQKPKGKATADVHNLFATLREFELKTSDEAEAEAVKIEGQLAAGTMTPEQEAHATLTAGLIRQIGGWHPAVRTYVHPTTGKNVRVVITPGADAARRAAFVANATRTFEDGYYHAKFDALLKAESRAYAREKLKKDSGKTGSDVERKARELEDLGLKGKIGEWALSFGSFEQIIRRVFGRDSKEGTRMVDWERACSNQATDAVFGMTANLDALFFRLGKGTALDGEKLRWKLAQPSATVQGLKLSEMEKIKVTMMWRQEDGRRDMQGHQDDTGAFTGEWHYGQDFVDACEDSLSPEALEVRQFLTDAYAAEWPALNPVFRLLNGIDLPHNLMYSPLTTKPQQAPGGQSIDPVTGSVMTGNSTTPGSLRSRGTSISQPVFSDALQTYIAHVKQIEHWKAYAEFNAESSAIFNNRSLGNAIEAKGGAESVQVLRGFLENLAAGGSRDAAQHLAFNRGLSALANNAAGIGVIGRIGVLAIQSLQLGAAAAEMPMGSYLKRIGQLLSGNLGWGDALASPYIQRRMKTMPPVVKQAMEGLASNKPNVVKHAVARLGLLITGADALFTSGTYAMVLDYQRGEGRKAKLTGPALEAYAHNAAERSTERVAQPVRAGTRSLYENTATNPMVRVSWAFASEARQKLALAAFTLADSQATAGDKVRAVFVAWVVGGMIATLVRSVWKDMRDDDEEWFDDKNWGGKRLVLMTLTGPLGGVPILGDVLEAGAYQATGQYLPEGNLFSSAGNAAAAVTHLKADVTGEREASKAIKDAESILSGMGIFNETLSAAASLSHLVRDMFGVVDNATGD